MAIVKQFRNKESEVYVWEITEQGNELITKINPLFITDLVKITNKNVKIQWLASRALLTQIVERKNIGANTIEKDEHGKPFFTHSDWYFSLSHSGSYACLIISKKALTGIDIETKRHQSFKLKTKFCSPIELHFIGNNIQNSALIWSCKEAIYKAYGKRKMIFKEDMVLMKENKNSLFFEVKQFKHPIEVHFLITNDYVLCYV